MILFRYRLQLAALAFGAAVAPIDAQAQTQVQPVETDMLFFGVFQLFLLLLQLKVAKNLLSPPPLINALQQYQATLQMTLPGQTQVSGAHYAAFSCPVFVGGGALLGEDSCVWGQASGQWSNQFGVAGQSAVFHVGGQKEIAPDWFVGFALGGGPAWRQSGVVTGQGQAFDGSLALKHTMGPWLIAGAIGIDTTALHFQRPDGLGATVQSDQSVLQGFVRVRGAYDLAFADWYLRPRLDVELDQTYTPGFQESGSSPVTIAVGSTATTRVAFTPMVEIGGRYDFADGTVLRPYFAGGAIVLPNNSSTAVLRFTGPLAVLGSFETTAYGPTVLGTAEVGLQLYRAHGWEAKVEYKIAAGDNTLSQIASLRGAWHF